MQAAVPEMMSPVRHCLTLVSPLQSRPRHRLCLAVIRAPARGGLPHRPGQLQQPPSRRRRPHPHLRCRAGRRRLRLRTRPPGWWRRCARQLRHAVCPPPPQDFGAPSWSLLVPLIPPFAVLRCSICLLSLLMCLLPCSVCSLFVAFSSLPLSGSCGVAAAVARGARWRRRRGACSGDGAD